MAKAKRHIIQPLTDHERLMLQYIKSRFHVGAVFSTRAELMGMDLEGPLVRMSALALRGALDDADGSLDMERCLKPGGSAFFEVVNANPERKFGPSSETLSRRAHSVRIKFF